MAGESTEVSVTMPDGRVQVFKGNRKMLKGYTVEGGKVKALFDFVNGQSIAFDLPESLVFQAAGHGVVQKAGDSAAGVEKPEDMFLAVQDTLDALAKGEWNVKREGGGFSGAGVVVRAICEVYGKTPEWVKEWIDAKIAKAEAAGSKLTRAGIYSAMRTSDKVGPKIKELEAAQTKKASGVDAESLLAELG